MVPELYFYLGPPSSVGNLTADLEWDDQCSILIEWEPPHLLPGLNVSYNVTLINGETVNHVTKSTNLTLDYYFDGDYCVNVMAFNGAIIGESTLKYSRGMYTLHNAILMIPSIVLL